MIKKILFVLFAIFSFNSVFCQENEENDNSINGIVINNKKRPDYMGKTYEPAESFKDLLSATDFLMEFAPAFYINDNSNGAPSPIIYPVSIGFFWPNYTFLSIQPTLSTFMMYHLWYDGQALPAEIENRTSATYSFIFNFPVVISLYPNDSNRAQFMGGLAFLVRFGHLPKGVESSDSGYSGSAGEDMSNINKYFWSNGRFLFISAGVCWLHNFTQRIKAGPSVNAYLPVGSILSGENLQSMIISCGLKVTL